MDTNRPLVSVTVITYNSSKFVVETLESIKSQTYQNIELIVSDDCSIDNTVELCSNWLNANSVRFVNVHIITSPVNTGIPANKNRSLTKCKGVWLKSIAGDDVLMETCIEDNVCYIENNIDCEIVFSKLVRFKNLNDAEENRIEFPTADFESFFLLAASEQYRKLLIKNYVANTPTSFIKMNFFNRFGYFNEKYPLFEDYPFWLNATKNGVKLNYFNKATIYYRMSESISNTRLKWVNERYFLSRKMHFNDCVSKDLKHIDLLKFFEWKLYYFRMNCLLRMFANQKNIVSKSFNFFTYNLSKSILVILTYLNRINSKKTID